MLLALRDKNSDSGDIHPWSCRMAEEGRADGFTYGKPDLTLLLTLGSQSSRSFSRMELGVAVSVVLRPAYWRWEMRSRSVLKATQLAQAQRRFCSAFSLVCVTPARCSQSMRSNAA